MAGEIYGERTMLRPVSEEDFPLLMAWFSDPEVYQWWGGRPLAKEEVEQKYLGRRRPAVESFVIQSEGKAIGYIQHWIKDSTSGGLDMFLIPQARGRGLGPDAALAMAQYLRDKRGWLRITVDPAVDNPRAINAWARAGFRLKQEIPDHPDGPAVLMVYEAKETAPN